MLFGAIAVHLVEPAVLTGFVLTIVYLTGPLAAAMQTLPSFGRASVALDRVQALGWTLAAARLPAADRQDAFPVALAPHRFRRRRTHVPVRGGAVYPRTAVFHDSPR